MTNEDQELQWTFYHIYDQSKGCYLIGSMLSGNGVCLTPEGNPLNTKEATLEVRSFEQDFFPKVVSFVWYDKIKRYITEQPIEVPVDVVSSDLRADLIVRNAIIARKSLDDLFK